LKTKKLMKILLLCCVVFSLPLFSQTTFVEMLKDGATDGSGNTIDGLDAAYSIIVSPDGKHVYAAGFNDDAVVVFTRDATTGKLTFVEMLKDGATDGSGNTINGLDGAISVTASPDGKHVYASANADAAVVVFTRDGATGKLTYVEMLKDGATDGSGNTIDGISGARSPAVSLDGKHVYATGFFDDAVAVFTRDATTGKLTYVEMLKDGANDGSGNPIDGLDGARSVTVSLDGKHVYAAGDLGDAVAVFTRDGATGKLTYVEMLKDGANDGSGNPIDGLDGPRSVTVSPDGKHVYTASFTDDAVVVFTRDATTGKLTYVEMLKDGATDGSGNTIDGIGGASLVTVSPDGKHVYATGYTDHAVAVFTRDATTGKLTYVEMLKDGATDGSGNTIDGLDAAISVTVSPDGKHVYTAGYNDDAVAVFGPAPPSLDFGDAPDTYKTTLASGDPARHTVGATPTVYLGTQVDTEADAQLPLDCTGDDNNNNDDEDGIFPFGYLLGVPKSAFVVDGGPSGGKLDAWIDFNQNGTFDHPAEHLFAGTSMDIVAGVNPPIEFDVPNFKSNLNLKMGPIARFRISTAGGLLPTGLAADGEVEDHVVYVDGDTDADGVPNSFENPGDTDGDGLNDPFDFDPAGWIYDETTGEIITGGLVSATTTNGFVMMVEDGSNGYYQFFILGMTGTADVTLTFTPPAGYLSSVTCLPQTGPYNPAQPPTAPGAVYRGSSEDAGNVGYLVDWTCSSNPYNLTFQFDINDPYVMDNNFPIFPTVPTSVELASFTVEVDQDGILTSWITETEPNNAGFNIYRSTEENGDYEKINASLVSAQGDATTGASYSYVDKPEAAGDYYYKLQAVSLDGRVSFHGPVFVGLTSVDMKKYAIPDNYSLSQNYPNPFNPETTIEFGLPKAGFVEISIYDINGKLARKLVSGQRSAGNHTVNWYAADELGNRMTSGIYYYQLKVGDFQQTNKMLLMK
jgi:6-phosphogluconolactonase (cycloisomerase 2 family)